MLRELAAESAIDSALVESAWQDRQYAHRILSNYDQARRHEIRAVPSFIFGERKLTGVVPEDLMRNAAGDLLNTGTSQANRIGP